MDEIMFSLTESNLDEGGRPRNPLEVCMNVDAPKAEYLGAHGGDGIPCLTDDGERIEGYISGDHLKNFRSRPSTALGEWLKSRRGALAGDEVYARWTEHPGYGRVLALRHVRASAVRAPE